MHWLLHHDVAIIPRIQDYQQYLIITGQIEKNYSFPWSIHTSTSKMKCSTTLIITMVNIGFLMIEENSTWENRTVMREVRFRWHLTERFFFDCVEQRYSMVYHPWKQHWDQHVNPWVLPHIQVDHESQLWNDSFDISTEILSLSRFDLLVNSCHRTSI